MKKVRQTISFLALVLISALLSMIAPISSVSAHGNNEGEGLEKTEGKKVPLLKELLSHNFPVTTKSRAAQEYFNQGLVLTYGFDHADAEVSFFEAAKHDPECAMAYWSVAYVLVLCDSGQIRFG